MEGFIQPPDVDAPATTGTPSSRAANAAAGTPISIAAAPGIPTVDAAAPVYPAWVLLEKEAYYNDYENATTAEAMTSTGKIVKVTFFLADPPAVSYFSVHGPELEHEDFLVVPRVVSSDKDLLLLRFALTVREPHDPTQYFVYKAAGHGRKPLLTPIPVTSHQPSNNTTSYPSILPSEDDDVNFRVAGLAMTSTIGHYVLHIFSSKTNEWTTRQLQLQASPAMTREDLPRLLHKVIALGAGTIGWVDLWRGILVCNVFDPDPILRFIPLPKPEFNFHLKGDPQQIRDVACCNNGFIKFIEMEHYARPASFYSNNNRRSCKTTKDLDSEDVLYDSELFFHSLAGQENPTTPPATWKIRTCYRHASWNLWRKGHTLHVDDILVNKPSYYTMLPQLWDDSAGKFTLRNLTAVCPTLSIHGGDLVYLVSKIGIYDKEAWVVGLDLRKKKVEVIEPYCAARSNLHQTSFLACTISGYLNATPRSCESEDAYGQNYPLNGYLKPENIIQNNLNMQIMGGYSRSSIQHRNDVHPINNFQFQPQLVVLPHSFPQTLQRNFTQSGSGYVCPMGAQSTYMLNTDAHAQLCLLMPKDNRFLPLILQEPASPSVPLNTLMRRMPMDGQFQQQMPPLPAYSAAPFDRTMHVRMQAPAYVPFN